MSNWIDGVTGKPVGPQCEPHCWHLHTGALLLVVKDGHVVESCCKCNAMRQIHRDHRAEWPSGRRGHGA